MALVAHISDLHFGAEDPQVAAGLLAALAALRPAVVVVTGDLTQRAREEQFAAARKFLDAIHAPRLIVPGNHDIPLYNVAARFLWPLENYQNYITPDLHPTFENGELAIAGINTARSNTWKDGRVSVADIAWLHEYFSGRPQPCKILAAHHPFIPPVRDPSAALVGRASQALGGLAGSGCRLILAGHLHHAYAGDVRPHHVEIEQSILVVQAGTAISHRRRGEANAFNVLRVAGSELTIEVHTWHGRAFSAAGASRFSFDESGWTPMSGEPTTTRA
jgi:3',5'-cyclic AMP phosphodiesterase CpdA